MVNSSICTIDWGSCKTGQCSWVHSIIWGTSCMQYVWTFYTNDIFSSLFVAWLWHYGWGAWSEVVGWSETTCSHCSSSATKSRHIATGWGMLYMIVVFLQQHVKRVQVWEWFYVGFCCNEPYWYIVATFAVSFKPYNNIVVVISWKLMICCRLPVLWMQRVSIWCRKPLTELWKEGLS